ncbi:MAG TPA: hypothetical protein VHT29_07280 [Solirubrobacteraceae bacterium]|nr:hypothetical protein [Solirubrobacteraceae bacterium]
MVLWTRFNEMGLPASHSLSLVAKSELVATGAEFLVPALLLSGVVVLLVIVLSNLGERTAKTLRLVSADTANDTAKREAALQVLTRRWIAPLLLAAVGVVFSLITLSLAPASALGLLFGVTLLGAVVLSCCAKLPFAAYCLVAFLAVGSFAIARTYERTANVLKVVPMAYSRTQPGEAPRVEVGYFVAETSDRIVFASVPEDPQNELREFPRDETDDLEVGALARPEAAERIAARFAYNLCERLLALRPAQAAPVSTGGKLGAAPTAPAPECDAAQIAQLKSKAGL